MQSERAQATAALIGTSITAVVLLATLTTPGVSAWWVTIAVALITGCVVCAGSAVLYLTIGDPEEEEET